MVTVDYEWVLVVMDGHGVTSGYWWLRVVTGGSGLVTGGYRGYYGNRWLRVDMGIYVWFWGGYGLLWGGNGWL